MIIEDPLPPEHGNGAWPCFEAECIFFTIVAMAWCQICVFPSRGL